jgi:hypothetical protein
MNELSSKNLNDLWLITIFTRIDYADFYIAQNDLADFVSDFNKEQELTMPIFISRKSLQKIG